MDKENKINHTIDTLKELEFIYSFVNIDKNKKDKTKKLRKIIRKLEEKKYDLENEEYYDD